MTLVGFGLDLAAALGVGALVGLEREHRKDEKSVVAGIRTFPLIAASGFLAQRAGASIDEPMVVAAGVAGAMALAIALFVVRSHHGSVGLTTPMAVVVTFLVGVLVGLDMTFEGILVGVATTFLLVTKRRLHGVARNLDEAEILSALQFVAVAFVVLPLAFTFRGPYLGGLVAAEGPIDPVWTVVVVVAVSAIGFVSFVALRELGPRAGLLASGTLGGLANSEAAAASLGALARAEPRLVPAAVAGTLAATLAMLVRNLVIFAIAARASAGVAGGLAIPLVPMMLVALVVAFAAARRVHDGVELKVGNPFALRPAIRFALVFTAVNAVAWILVEAWGEAGVYLTSLGALVSAGAVVASAAALVASGSVAPLTAVVTATLATLIGVANKLAIAGMAERALVRRLAVPLAAVLAAGVAGLAVLLATGAYAGS